MVLISAIWGRPELTARVLQYHAALNFSHRIAVVSPEDPASDLYTPDNFPGWLFVHAPNEPLGKKWNTAVKAASLFDPDAVMITGSDDLISPAYLTLAEEAVSMYGGDYAYVHPESIYMIQDERTVYCDPFPTGAGRVVRSDALRRVRWKLWPDDQTERLDGAMDHVLRENTRQFCPKVRDYPVLDIKTEGNMWTLEGNEIVRGEKRMKIREVEDVDRAALMQAFPGFESFERRAA